MKVGTLKPVVEKELRRGLRPSFSSGFGTSGPNGGNGGGGDDGDHGNRNDFARHEERVGVPDKAKVITWFLLLVVLMTFGGLIGAYIFVSSTKAAEWRTFSLPVQIWISTAVILFSSVTYQIAKRAIDNNDQLKIQRFLIATTVLGAIFISSQLLAWLSMVNRGLYMQGNPYAGFFYIITAAHAIHVIGGIVALGAILLRSWYPSRDANELEHRRNLGRSVGWYWHFMGGLWVAIFLLLGLWN